MLFACQQSLQEKYLSLLSLKNPTWSRMQTTAPPFSYCELKSFCGNIRRSLQIPFILYHVKDCEVLGSTARPSLPRGPVLVAWYHLVLNLHNTDFIRDFFLPTSTHYRNSLLRPPRAPSGRGYQYDFLPNILAALLSACSVS